MECLEWLYLSKVIQYGGILLIIKKKTELVVGSKLCVIDFNY